MCSHASMNSTVRETCVGDNNMTWSQSASINLAYCSHHRRSVFDRATTWVLNTSIGSVYESTELFTRSSSGCECELRWPLVIWLHIVSYTVHTQLNIRVCCVNCYIITKGLILACFVSTRISPMTPKGLPYSHVVNISLKYSIFTDTMTDRGLLLWLDPHLFWGCASLGNGTTGHSVAPHGVVGCVGSVFCMADSTHLLSRRSVDGECDG